MRKHEVDETTLRRLDGGGGDEVVAVGEERKEEEEAGAFESKLISRAGGEVASWIGADDGGLLR
jgi:hypothetical protein